MAKETPPAMKKDIGMRIRAFREKQKLKQEDLANEIGTTAGNLGHIERGSQLPSFEQLQKLVRFSKLSYQYWVEGVPKGQIETIEYAGNHSNAKELDLNKYQIMLVPSAQEVAKAGYLSGYANQEYIDTLPKIPWIVDRQYKGNYICFEVSGDSMDDGSRESYITGDIVLGREINRDLWLNSKLHIHKWDFVVVHRTEGIVIKRIIAHDVEKGILTLHSLNNLLYPDFQVKVDDIFQIFNIVKTLRTND